jgi:glycerol-1-phosphate dehydrogenase [NAD(P)+]
LRIDSAKFSGPCACGAIHTMETRLCIIEAGALARFDAYLVEAGVSGKRCAVYDEHTYAIPGLRALRSEQQIVLPGRGLHADEHSTAEVLAELEPDVEVLIAVGGGPVHDIVRFCARERSLSFVSVPTAASCDGYASQVAAMTWEGFKKTISDCGAPVLVAADVDIIRSAPPRLVVSGVGDMLGKYIALAEWQMANAVTGEAVCPTIFKLMKEAVDQVWEHCLAAREGDTAALTAVTYGLLMSGLAMQMMGNSRPASGAEHHISHLIEVEPEQLTVHSTASHGEKVGVGTLLASTEYHRLAAIEEIAPYVLPYRPIDETWLRTYFGERLYPTLHAENTHDCLAAVTPEQIVRAWPRIRAIIAQIPAPAAIEDKLTRLGAKKCLEDLGVPEEKRGLILDTAPLIRNRLTLMRMRRMIRA